MNLIETRQLIKEFPRQLRSSFIRTIIGRGRAVTSVRVLNGVTFSLQAGEIVRLRGENGSGKSTFLRILAGIFEPSEGSVVRNARIAAILSPHSYFFDELPLDVSLRFACSSFGVPKPTQASLITEVLSSFSEISGESKAFFLTPGQRTRTLITLAANSPSKVLVLDETISSLDEKNLGEIEDIFKRFCSSGGAVLFVAHNQQFPFMTREVRLARGLIA